MENQDDVDYFDLLQIRENIRKIKQTKNKIDQQKNQATITDFLIK
jgi:hypothetical protein